MTKSREILISILLLLSLSMQLGGYSQSPSCLEAKSEAESRTIRIVEAKEYTKTSFAPFCIVTATLQFSPEILRFSSVSSYSVNTPGSNYLQISFFNHSPPHLS